MITPYKIEERKDKWVILREDKTIVNDIEFTSLELANKYLDRLRAFGYDRPFRREK